MKKSLKKLLALTLALVLCLSLFPVQVFAEEEPVLEEPASVDPNASGFDSGEGLRILYWKTRQRIRFFFLPQA